MRPIGIFSIMFKVPVAAIVAIIMSLYCFFCVPAVFVDLATRNSEMKLTNKWYKGCEKMSDSLVAFSGFYG